MPNYVKFLRGNHAAYNALTSKDTDTLYFVYEDDESSGELYLGSKLIAGSSSGTGSSATYLSDLKDVILTSVQNKDLLVYDSASGWVNKSLDDAISVMVGSTSSSSGIAGLVPAPEATENFRYLRNDGVWAEIEYEPQIFIVENNEKLDHTELIQSTVVNSTLLKGDMFIVKDPIAEDKYQHTAYIYDGSKWIAMDGNYSAENVYFNEDFIFTEAIGTVEIPASGNITVSASGKNLKEFFASIFAKETAPAVIDPSLSISLASSTTLYEVGTTYTPGYSVSFNPGSYEFGPDTDITASLRVEDSNGNSSVDAAGSFGAFTIGTDTQYTVSVTAEYTEGAIPFNNLGNEHPASKIESGTLTASTTTAVKGYRKSFYGTLTEKAETLNSDNIRSLTKSSTSALKNGSSFTINIPVGTLRVVIAYPAALRDMTSVLDKNDSNSNIVSGFGTPETIAVEGANDYEAIDYKVYKMDFANPYDASNVFTVTI